MANPDAPAITGDFPSATEADWRKLVDAVLKGAPFERLKSRTHDGLTIEPLYPRARTATTIAGRPTGTPWAVLQRVDHPDPAAANAQAKEDLGNGANGLVLVFAESVSANGFGLEAAAPSLAQVLDGIDLGRDTILDLNLSPRTRGVVRDLATLIKHRGIDPPSIDLRFSLNPIGGFAASGRSPQTWQNLAPSFAATIGELAADGFRGPFAVADGRVIHNAGGSEAQELAFALASALTYLRALEQSGMSLEAAYAAIYFRLTADADQFLTTAKFRALRKLWTRVATASGLPPKPAIVMAETAWRTMTRRDPYANILRATIAVAAAGLGGADAVTVLPHTAALGLSDAFARRVARNMQLILLEESNLARVTDPAAGSGAFESLTEQLCLAAWTQLQAIERAGGAWAALESGLVQRNVAAVRAALEQAVAHGQDILTGSNAFPDIAETPPAVLDVKPRAAASEQPATVTVAPLPRLRLTEPFESLRDQSDRILAATGARPKIFLAAIGAPAEFTARVNFAKNFFEAGGVEAVPGAPADYRRAQAALACLCASDKMSATELASVAAALKNAGARHIYCAGRLGAREELLREAGVQSFIDEGCDALATLNAAYDIVRVPKR
ncbi:MAG TPA: methylmalonyl-CoA mutase family protein [Xanthobacteraceae bacterium]|nr:methylmalonyl-CoA mutase family protein [Xanthobacteraceae bacterium]